MERIDQNKYLHKISLRRQVFVEGKILEILQLKKSVFSYCMFGQLEAASER